MKPYNAMDPTTWYIKERRQPEAFTVGPTYPVQELNPGDAVFDNGPQVWRGIVEIRVHDAGYKFYPADAGTTWKGYQLVFEDGGSVLVPEGIRFFRSETGLVGWSSSRAATGAFLWGDPEVLEVA